MTDKELIKQEIERLYAEVSQKPYNGDVEGEMCAYDKLISFIDSLTEESTSEDLEEEIKNYIQKEYPDGMGFPNVPKIARHFAEWQKQQMMKNVVLETEVLMDCDGDGIETPYEEWLTLEDTEIPCVPDGFKDGDIVKVILVKEDLP